MEEKSSWPRRLENVSTPSQNLKEVVELSPGNLFTLWAKKVINKIPKIVGVTFDPQPLNGKRWIDLKTLDEDEQ